ncbi:uncharacterized protein JCM10292_000314 [Rhodotorula paludigena]|uniref:uncharacterized protein n=1 Tax=Rhodotorula paludigena TaxID=86838 RepID=UPI003176B066
MRLSLEPAPSVLSQISASPEPSDAPLVWIDREPFLVELQGALEAPAGEEAAGTEASECARAIEGVRVGKVDLSDPKKPVMRIAHHRLEGKVEKLLTPYALLRTTRSAPSSSVADTSAILDCPPRAAKRQKLDTSSASTDSTAPRAEPERAAGAAAATTQIAVVALIRHKLLFSRRPEPLIEVSSEADPTFAERKKEALREREGKGRGAAGAKAAMALFGAKKGAGGETAAAVK